MLRLWALPKTITGKEKRKYFIINYYTTYNMWTIFFSCYHILRNWKCRWFYNFIEIISSIFQKVYIAGKNIVRTVTRSKAVFHYSNIHSRLMRVTDCFQLMERIDWSWSAWWLWQRFSSINLNVSISMAFDDRLNRNAFVWIQMT